MTTNVPAPSLTATGFVAPDESAILAGVMADLQAAFGGALNADPTTPQGQIAATTAAIIGNAYSQMLALFNGVDPAYADGRMQDAIARIYFLTRNPAEATVVTATCSGLEGTVIPIGATAQDQGGNLYTATQSGTITSLGTVDLEFTCAATGPIACPPGYLSKVYRAIPGWDSITNAAAGVLGREEESRADFEFRRQQSVAMNSQGSLASILGAVLNVPGVLDAYAAENNAGTDSGASFTATISGTTMTVSAVAGGALSVGQIVTGAGVTAGTVIQSPGSGTGGTGTYILNISQTVGSATAMTSGVGGVRMVPHSILVSVYGGDPDAVGRAIWSKKMPGSNYNGNTTVTVLDTANFSPPYPAYDVTFYIPTPTAVKFAVTMQSNPVLPSDAVAQVRAAIIAAFNGQDGGPRARMGAWIFATRFVGNIAALGSWALVYQIQVGVGTANQTSVILPVTQIPTITAADISVNFV